MKKSNEEKDAFDIEREKREIGDLVANKIQNCIVLFKIKSQIHDEKKVKIAIPAYAFNLLNKAFFANVYVKQENNFLKFMGYELITGYENSVVVFHEDAPIRKDPSELIAKVSLS